MIREGRNTAQSKRHRKCDTVKYKRRRGKEAVSHREGLRRRYLEQAECSRILSAAREHARTEMMERQRCGQRIVNALSAYLCSLDPEYASDLHVRDLFRVFGAVTGVDVRQFIAWHGPPSSLPLLARGKV